MGCQVPVSGPPSLLANFANLSITGIMPTRNVNLTDELDRFVVERVKSGKYENASEVVRDALRILERAEREYEAKLAALRQALDEGDQSGIAEGDVFARVREKLKLPKSSL